MVYSGALRLADIIIWIVCPITIQLNILKSMTSQLSIPKSRDAIAKKEQVEYLVGLCPSILKKRR